MSVQDSPSIYTTNQRLWKLNSCIGNLRSQFFFFYVFMKNLILEFQSCMILEHVLTKPWHMFFMYVYTYIYINVYYVYTYTCSDYFLCSPGHEKKLLSGKNRFTRKCQKKRSRLVQYVGSDPWSDSKKHLILLRLTITLEDENWQTGNNEYNENM